MDKVQTQGNDKDSSSITQIVSGLLFSEIVLSPLFSTTTCIDLASNASVDIVTTFNSLIRKAILFLHAFECQATVYGRRTIVKSSRF